MRRDWALPDSEARYLDINNQWEPRYSIGLFFVIARFAAPRVSRMILDPFDRDSLSGWPPNRTADRRCPIAGRRCYGLSDPSRTNGIIPQIAR
ncbi:hypothetical protein B7486_14135 [cyanobacterium TDX16]|nr:hypothetical protein B7486_14135 [cyanobacterium TDX16]